MRTRAEKTSSNNEYMQSNKIRSEWSRRSCVCMSLYELVLFVYVECVPRDDCRAGRHAHSRTNGRPLRRSVKTMAHEIQTYVALSYTQLAEQTSTRHSRTHTHKLAKPKKQNKRKARTHTDRSSEHSTRAHTLFARHTVPTDAFRAACERPKQRSTLIESNSRMLLSLAGVVRRLHALCV